MGVTTQLIEDRELRIACGMLAVSLLACASLSCGDQTQEPPNAADPAISVHVREILPERVPDIHEAVGTVRPRLSATVAAKVTAAIEQVLVEAGDSVHTGDLLAKLDDRELRAEFERARADYERFKKLLEKEAATRAEFEAVQSRYRIAAATISYASITSPFDGVVAQKLCDVGDLAAPGKPLFTVDQTASFRLEASVPEGLAGSVEMGENVAVLVDATGEECAGIIGEIVPAADPASRSFLIKIDLQCRRLLKSGMFGRARLTVGERWGLFVPKAALRERGQLTYLFVTSEGRAEMRLVKTREADADAAEVLAGLQPGERVIVSAEGEPRDGQRVDAR